LHSDITAASGIQPAVCGLTNHKTKITDHSSQHKSDVQERFLWDSDLGRRVRYSCHWFTTSLPVKWNDLVEEVPILSQIKTVPSIQFP